MCLRLPMKAQAHSTVGGTQIATYISTQLTLTVSLQLELVMYTKRLNAMYLTLVRETPYHSIDGSTQERATTFTLSIQLVNRVHLLAIWPREKRVMYFLQEHQRPLRCIDG